LLCYLSTKKSSMKTSISTQPAQITSTSQCKTISLLD
jgi:hypothetical protein